MATLMQLVVLFVAMWLASRMTAGLLARLARRKSAAQEAARMRKLANVEATLAQLHAAERWSAEDYDRQAMLQLEHDRLQRKAAIYQ